MAFFSQIDPTNTRRFAGPDGCSILAIYDQCRGWTKYAAVGTDENGRLCFVSEPRTYWSDEVSEISAGGHWQ